MHWYLRSMLVLSLMVGTFSGIHCSEWDTLSCRSLTEGVGTVSFSCTALTSKARCPVCCLLLIVVSSYLTMPPETHLSACATFHLLLSNLSCLRVLSPTSRVCVFCLSFRLSRFPLSCRPLSFPSLSFRPLSFRLSHFPLSFTLPFVTSRRIRIRVARCVALRGYLLAPSAPPTPPHPSLLKL